MTESNSDRGLAKQNASLTVLVASTLGASLSAVPQSQEAQEEQSNAPKQRTVCFEEEPQTGSAESNLDSGSRKRISLTRLHFNSKKSAGSESSRGEALTKQESFSTPSTTLTTSPPVMAAAASTNLSSQNSRDVDQ